MSGMSSLTAVQRVRQGRRTNWRIGQLIAFAHGPDRANIFRWRVRELGPDGLPAQSELVGGRGWKRTA